LLSPKLYIETFLWVKNEDGLIVPFEFNPMQIKYYEYLMDTYFKPFKRPDGTWGHRFQGIRDIHLKHRQYGLSTLICALFFHDTLLNPGTNSVVYCHKLPESIEMLDKWHIFIDNLPSDFKPICSKKNTHEVKFAGMASGCKAKTPGFSETSARGQGRSTTIRNAHLSEFSDWAYPDEAYQALQKAVPATGNIIIEATANQMGDDYHVMYENSVKGSNNFRPYFTPWHSNPENVLLVTREEAKEIISTLTVEEKKVVKTYTLNINQLAWRRSEVKAANGDMARFMKENPENDTECFMTSGKLIFPRYLHKQTCQPRAAIPGPLHVISVDVALGVEGGDNSAI
jgi:hypothetical protein